MKKLKGVFLDAAITRISRDLIALEGTGLAVDVDETLRKLNEKHHIVPIEELENLQNDVNLSITMERGRRLKSASTFGYGSYRAVPYVDKAVEAMTTLGEVVASLGSEKQKVSS